MPSKAYLMLMVYEKTRIEMKIGNSFLVFPAQAGTHLSAAP